MKQMGTVLKCFKNETKQDRPQVCQKIIDKTKNLIDNKYIKKRQTKHEKKSQESQRRKCNNVCF